LRVRLRASKLAHPQTTESEGIPATGLGDTMFVCVVGSGYVGLVTGTCLAEIGHNVVCIDVDEQKIARLKQSQVPIYEPGIQELILTNQALGRLSFSGDISDAAERGCDFYFFAVGTPPRAEDGGADLTQVFAAVEVTAQALARQGNVAQRFAVFVTKSTVPVGTSREVARIVARHLPEEQFAVASNPEFLREGCAVYDFLNPDRIIAGSQSERARAMLEELYRPLTRHGRPLVVTTTVETAELIKYAANGFLATKLTFINELSRLCEKLGADVEELALGIGLDKRIGDMFLKPGPGYGGSCIPKDTLALIKTARDFNSPVEIIETVVRVNNRHKNLMFAKISEALGGCVAGKRIAVLGLAFKANTDDVRDSPALTIVPILQREEAEVTVYDPVALENAKASLGNGAINYVDTVAVAVAGADACVILTEWPEFRTIDWPALAPTMARPLLIDLRNLYSGSHATIMGMDYISLGRNPVMAKSR
jgi:UDPglucose 6-dehydrogenase